MDKYNMELQGKGGSGNNQKVMWGLGSILNRRYEVEELLGLHVFGFVYRVFDLDERKLRIIKGYCPDAMKHSHPKQKDNWCKLAEKNQAILFDSFEIDDDHYYVTENLYPLTYLRDFIQYKRFEKYSCNELLRMTLPVIDELINMNNAKIFHFNVCPENIFTDRREKKDIFRLLHFPQYGYSVSSFERNRVDPSWDPLMTFGPYDNPFLPTEFPDSYSMAAVLYYLLTGSEPKSMYYRSQDKNNEILPPPVQINKKVPKNISNILVEMLSHEETRENPLIPLRQEIQNLG